MLEFEAPHEAAAAGFDDVWARKGAEFFGEVASFLGHHFSGPGALEDLERFEGHRAADRVAEEGAGVERFAGGFGPGVHDFGLADAGGDGEAAAEGFAEADEVGDDAVPFASEGFSTAMEAGVDFIEDEEGVILIAPIAEAGKKIGWGDDFSAAALDGLHEDRADVRAIEGVDLISGEGEAGGDGGELVVEGTVEFREVGPKEAAVAEAVVAVLESDETFLTRGEAGSFEGGFNGFEAGI